MDLQMFLHHSPWSQSDFLVLKKWPQNVQKGPAPKSRPRQCRWGRWDRCWSSIPWAWLTPEGLPEEILPLDPRYKGKSRIPGLVNVYITNWKDPPCLMGKLTISMAIFNSYVKLPEGKSRINQGVKRGQTNRQFLEKNIPWSISKKRHLRDISGRSWSYLNYPRSCKVYMRRPKSAFEYHPCGLWKGTYQVPRATEPGPRIWSSSTTGNLYLGSLGNKYSQCYNHR